MDIHRAEHEYYTYLKTVWSNVSIPRNHQEVIMTMKDLKKMDLGIKEYSHEKIKEKMKICKPKQHKKGLLLKAPRPQIECCCSHLKAPGICRVGEYNLPHIQSPGHSQQFDFFLNLTSGRLRANCV